MKFGIDRADITPDYRTLMAGYAERMDVNDAINDPLTFTSVVFEEKGCRFFLGAADLCTLGYEYSMRLRKKIAHTLDTDTSAVIINCSHTHGSIETRFLDFFDGKQREYVAKNRSFLEKKILGSAKRAAGNMQVGKLFYGEGTTAIPMNRRRIINGKVWNKPNPDGDTDNSLKILKITDSRGRISAIIARVSCHPVATGAQHMLTADFPGAFRAIFESHFPGAFAIFLQGVGGDARPSRAAGDGRWLTLPYSELPVIGECLFRETLGILTGEMEPLDDLSFFSADKEVFLPALDNKIDRYEIIEQIKDTSGPRKICLEKLLELERRGKPACSGLPVVVQMFSLNRRFSILGVQAEVLCSLGRKIEGKMRSALKMVLGCTNGAQCYLLDKKEYMKGGYEADTMVLKLFSSPLSPTMEDIVLNAVTELDAKMHCKTSPEK